MVDTPYGADRENRIIYTNPKLACRLTLFEKKFWLLHEKGHIVLDTADEIKADNYAFDRLAGTEFRSLKQMIEAAENLLTSGSKYHQERIDNLYRRAIEWDMQHPEISRADGKKAKKAEAEAKQAEENRKQLETIGSQFIAMQQSSASSTTQAAQSTTLGTTMSNSSLLIIVLIAILLLRK